MRDCPALNARRHLASKLRIPILPDQAIKAAAMNSAISPLLTDLYQINMIQAYLDHGDTETAVFEFFARTLPARRGFLLAAGLEQALDFLENLRFSADEIAWLKSTGRFKQNLLDYLGAFSLQRRRPRHARRHGVLRQRADPARDRAVAASAIRRIAPDQYSALSVAGRRQGGAHAARRAGQGAGRFRAAARARRRGRTDGGAGELHRRLCRHRHGAGRRNVRHPALRHHGAFLHRGVRRRDDGVRDFCARAARQSRACCSTLTIPRRRREKSWRWRRG